MLNDMPSQADTRAFYDAFLHSRLLEYRLQPNLRLEQAWGLIRKHVRPHTVALEIGCGIGILTERIARQASRGFVWACDISEEVVWYANQTVRSPRVTFFAADVLREFETLRARLDKAIDLILMIDVLEHLPLTSHASLFSDLRSIASDRAVVVITHPSSSYQEYLRAHDPAELQIIDEIVQASHLVQVSRDAGFQLKYYSLQDVWLQEQYIHCVVQLPATSTMMTSVRPRSFLSRVRRRVSHLYHRLMRPLLYRKYVTRVFRDRP
jgi:trans-aconitate 2-methyltransferase